ncbi:hypothetical protein V6N11_058944 [Hibiscus sabdariffa]|uniref:Uncharacterized protein n=1 Tax=Hibiscus sabdariffa TaxID=183260 RepID=A0ABR2U613_9ROSI
MYLEKIRMKMKMENAFYVEQEGITGGMALWWSLDVKLTVLVRAEHTRGRTKEVMMMLFVKNWILLTSLEWNFLFPRAVAVVEVAIASDHAPILLLTNGMEKRATKDFKFESNWLLEEECPRIVNEEWNGGLKEICNL